jgi:peptidyl-prolyl cis-trans isomerase B (cyclophilin B)
MAKSSAEPPGTSGSQFYVVTGADAGLPPEYALVGKVSEGLDVVERIGKLPTNPSTEKPKQTVLIEKITIEKG